MVSKACCILLSVRETLCVLFFLTRSEQSCALCDQVLLFFLLISFLLLQLGIKVLLIILINIILTKVWTKKLDQEVQGLSILLR